MRYMVYYKVSTGSRVRFESVDIEAARDFVREIYKAEAVIATIDEIERD